MGRSSRAIRTTAWAVVAAGVAAPVVRKRVKAPPLVLQSVAFGAPLGLSVAMRRSRTRDVAVCCLQMWAYVSAYKTPHDDEQPPERARPRRLSNHCRRGARLSVVCPPCACSGRLPRPTAGGLLDKILVWTHWAWFLVPHTALGWILWRRRERFPRAAVMTYAVFDLGACLYWIVPTAPPWYAATVAERQQLGGEVAVRRMMAEYGEFFWKDGWGPLYGVFGGNPVAAMPSLHFATSLMAALLLAETGPVAGALGLGYTATLGFALIYLGEHYVIDLVGGAALTMLVRGAGPACRATAGARARQPCRPGGAGGRRR